MGAEEAPLLARKRGGRSRVYMYIYAYIYLYIIYSLGCLLMYIQANKYVHTYTGYLRTPNVL